MSERYTLEALTDLAQQLSAGDSRARKKALKLLRSDQHLRNAILLVVRAVEIQTEAKRHRADAEGTDDPRLPKVAEILSTLTAMQTDLDLNVRQAANEVVAMLRI